MALGFSIAGAEPGSQENNSPGEASLTAREVASHWMVVKPLDGNVISFKTYHYSIIRSLPYNTIPAYYQDSFGLIPLSPCLVMHDSPKELAAVPA